MYSILFRVVKDRDIYMYYKTYTEEKELDEIYKTSDIKELSEKVKGLMENGVAWGDIKIVKDVDIEVVLNLKTSEENTSTDDITDTDDSTSDIDGVDGTEE